MENNPEPTVKHVFGCEVCAYETNLYTNLVRHLKSSKHLSNEHNLVYKKQTPEELLKECVLRIKELEEIIKQKDKEIKQKDKEISKKDKRNVLLRDQLAAERNGKEYYEKQYETLYNKTFSDNPHNKKKIESPIIENEVITNHEC